MGVCVCAWRRQVGNLLCLETGSRGPARPKGFFLRSLAKKGHWQASRPNSSCRFRFYRLASRRSGLRFGSGNYSGPVRLTHTHTHTHKHAHAHTHASAGDRHPPGAELRRALARPSVGWIREKGWNWLSNEFGGHAPRRPAGLRGLSGCGMPSDTRSCLVSGPRPEAMTQLQPGITLSRHS